ncbi:hypothetical protein [Bradyrhizobium sp. dw_411]|uniref:hypothetical protein n=1 Tax=Bradyrhizobium sp. dw_411 TaxID=2720082 RepID=UPI001BCF08B5|nr:hypothetical protein [Bradyrhizobium sp. dw_411]
MGRKTIPNIKPFEAPNNLGLQPTETGIEAASQAARSIRASYGEAADTLKETGRLAASTIQDVGDVAVKYEEHQEISHGAAQFATAMSGLDGAWNKTINTADANDSSVAAKFRDETLEPQLDKLRDAFITEGGQKYAEAQIGRIRDHFVVKTSADMSTKAGYAVQQNITTLVNQLSNAALNDPTSLKTSLDLIEHSIGAMVDSSPNLRSADRERIKTEVLQNSQATIVKSAAVGAVAINPEAGLKQFSSPEYGKWVNGAELKALEQQSRTVQSAMRTDQTRQLALQKQEAQDKSDQAEGQYLAKLHDDDPSVSGQVTAKAIANDFTLTREARERMIGIVNREMKPEAASKISNGTAADLIARIRAPVGDPNRIDDLNPVYDAFEKGKLNKSDLKFVRDEFANIRTPEGEALSRRQAEFIDSVKPLIDKSNPLMGKIDQSGHQQIYNFTLDLQRKVAEFRKAGKDPRSLMDPQSPDYMGSPAALMPYQRTLQQSQQDIAKSLRGGGLPAADTITGLQAVPAPAATSVPRPPAAKPPEKGTVKDGYEFLGGNPGVASSWRKVEERS